MENLSKVITGMKCCAGYEDCLGCPYYPPTPNSCQKLLKDAVKLLEEYKEFRDIEKTAHARRGCKQ